MAQLRLFMEKTGGRSPGSAGFSVRGQGRATGIYLIGNDGTGTYERITDRLEILNAITELLGNTETHEDTFRMKRTLPMGHPIYPHLFCDAISAITGIGNPGTMATSDPDGILEAPVLDYTVLQPCYEFSGVSFSQRPFAVLSDDSIQVKTLDVQADGQYWEDIDGTLMSTPNQYAEEWLRFCDVETIPSGEYITAQAGQYIYDVDPVNGSGSGSGCSPCSGSGSGGQCGVLPDGVSAGNGQLRMLLRQKTVLLTAYHVPYEYVEPDDISVRSFIADAIGTINQFDWWKYPKGTLLLESIAVSRYVPPVPKVAPVVDNAYGGTVKLAHENKKLCDIQFKFIHVNRQRRGIARDGTGTWTHAPRPPLSKASGGPGKIQAVQNGHNLVPWAHSMEFFYIRSKHVDNYDGSNCSPLYPSSVFQFLLTNPGVTL